VVTLALIVACLFVAPSLDEFKFTDADKVVKSPTGLEYADVKEGTGAAASSGQLAIVQYVLKLDDGKEIDSSRKPGRSPFRFTIGKSEVIKGWDEGLVGMKPGGIRKLKIPASLGYGEKGAGGVIPGGATLWFTVELLAATNPCGFAADEKVSELPTGLKYVDLLQGKGAEAVAGMKVTAHYTLYSDSGERLETSLRSGGRPIEFKAGAGQMIAGFDEGILGMKPGGVRKLRIPSTLGYGVNGSGPVKPNETIWFIVELVEAKKQP
jgi:FKBP-type peptidyl-prolyl cis-trans isomerase